MNWKTQLLRYWLAMNASAVDAAVQSTSAFFGVAGAHAVTETIPALTPEQFVGVLLLSFGRGLLKYLGDHPLSALLPQSPTTETGK